MGTIITAHSGCDGTEDNSLEFLEYAMKCGADALEIDVRRRRDGSYYLSHEPSERPCPDLKTAFEILKESDKLINCDLKQPDMERGILSLAQGCGISDRLRFSGSVSLSSLKENDAVRERVLFNISSALPELTAGHRRGALPAAEQWEQALRVCGEFGIKTINIPFELCTDESMEIISSAGVRISAWTVDDESVARRLLGRNIYNITTRRVKALCALREA